MKKKLLIFSSVSILAIIAVVLYQQDVFSNQSSPSNEIVELRKKHKEFLENSPMKHTLNMSKDERKELGLPPNAYNEQMFELTMDPALGYPVPERVYTLQEELAAIRAPGSWSGNAWVERGPYNTGGRTRMLRWSPAVGSTIAFAGGVSGGLYKNNNVTINSEWQLITTVPGNIAVSSITADPTNPTTLYLGTGEQYTQGVANGNGIYKSIDNGNTWTRLTVNLAGGGDTTAGSNFLVSGLYYVNDIQAWEDPSGTVHIFAGIGSAGYVGSGGGGSSSPSNVLGLQNSGLYDSTDGGATWTRIEDTDYDYSYFGQTYYAIPNDFIVSADNTLYFGTIRASFTNAGIAGRIYKTTDGVDFTQAAQLTSSNRVQIEPSGTDPNKMYALAQGVGATPVRIFQTTDGWATFTTTNLPNDADNGIPANDFTRGQSFYDLMLAVDPTDDDIIYVGGIDMHRSADGGSSWTQISKWSNNPNLNTLTVPFVHADIHSLIFRPGFPNEALIGTDGGVYYATSLSAAGGSSSAILKRNQNYNVTQFYYGAINEVDIANGDDLAAGAQDNGTLFRNNAPAGSSVYFDPVGGDGGFTDIDDSGTYAITTYPGNSHIYLAFPVTGAGYQIDSGEGFFINPAGLDKNLDILYSNGQQGGNEQIKRYVLSSTSAVTTVLDDALIDNSAPVAFKVSPYTTASTKLFLGTTTGKVIRLDDADTTPTWTEITGPSFVGSVSDIEFGENEQEIFVTFHNYGVTSIWFTDDGGTTWQNKEGDLPDMPVKCIVQNPIYPDEVIIGTELGIWSTIDYTAASPTWVQSNNGMMDIRVVDLDVRIADNRVLATTHGRGLFTGDFSSDPLSVNDISVLNGVVVFPTVSNGEITIQSNISLGDVTVEVYAVTGQKVSSEIITLNQGSNVQLNLSGMNSGMYFIKLNASGATKTERIIIR